MREPVVLEDVAGGAGAICAEILALLPTWFGIPESNADYVATAETHPGVVARAGEEAVGITTVKHHSPYAAEIYLMAVKPAFHRHGIGHRMVRRVEQHLAAAGVEFLQVKTLSASRPDEGYAKTRAFWLACGFRPLEEFPTLWDPSNPALQLIKTVPRVSAAAEQHPGWMARKIATNTPVGREELLDFIRPRHRVVLTTIRADGSVQASPVTAGVDDEGRVVVSSYPERAKVANARRNPAGSALFLSDDWNGPWVQTSGRFEVIDLPDALEPLVDYYRAIAGEHPDWDEYRSAMREQGKCLLRLTIDTWGPVATGGFPARLADR